MHNNIFKGFIGNEENCQVWLDIINYLTVKENVNMKKTVKTSAEKLTTEQRDLVMARGINHYGEKYVEDLFFEESGELTKALLKARRYELNEERMKDIIDELADVSNVIDMLKIMYDCSDEVEERRDFKIKRMRDRMDADDNTKTSEHINSVTIKPKRISVEALVSLRKQAKMNGDTTAVDDIKKILNTAYPISRSKNNINALVNLMKQAKTKYDLYKILTAVSFDDDGEPHILIAEE